MRNGRQVGAATPRGGGRPSGRKPLLLGKKYLWGEPRGKTVPGQQAPANYVPAAAVIRRGRALSGFIGRKGRVGGLQQWRVESPRSPGRGRARRGDWRQAEGRGTGGVGVKSVEPVRNTSGEGGDLGLTFSSSWAAPLGVGQGEEPDAEARKRGERTELDTPVVHALNDGHSVSGVSTPPAPQRTR